MASYGENGVLFHADEMKELAIFLAEIIRQGVTYKVARSQNDEQATFEVILTGGF
jgi:hypothetical protein